MSFLFLFFLQLRDCVLAGSTASTRKLRIGCIYEPLVHPLTKSVSEHVVACRVSSTKCSCNELMVFFLQL